MPVAQTDLDSKARSQEARASAWVVRARSRIDRSIGDAAAHATKALTDALKATRDGRRTLAKARRSRSLQAAHNRLGELLDALAGPSIDSLAGLVRDARADLYADALTHWARLIPDRYLRPDPASYRDDELLDVRRLSLHGLELRAELGAPIEAAGRQLDAAVALAARRSTPEKVASDLIDGWAQRARTAIGQAVETAIMDGAYRCDVAAGWHAVSPDLRDGESPLHA